MPAISAELVLLGGGGGVLPTFGRLAAGNLTGQLAATSRHHHRLGRGNGLGLPLAPIVLLVVVLLLPGGGEGGGSLLLKRLASLCQSLAAAFSVAVGRPGQALRTQTSKIIATLWTCGAGARRSDIFFRAIICIRLHGSSAEKVIHSLFFSRLFYHFL